MAYSSSSSFYPSSQFGLFPLFAISVGFLLLTASNFASGKLHSKWDRPYALFQSQLNSPGMLF
jgi:hypothetical protein